MDRKLHKENSLIEITPRNLNTNQRKGFNAFLKIAKEELKRNSNFDYWNDRFEITTKEVKSLTGIPGGNKKVFDYLKGLMDKKIIEYDDEKGFITSVINSIKLEGEIIKFDFSKYVHKRLMELDYTTLDLGEMSLLSNKHAITLYEWFLRYKNFKPNGEYYNPLWELEEFRVKIGATAKSYEKTKELKRAVIVPAIEELNKKTHLQVSYELLKKGGRKYSHIQLHLERKEVIEAEIIEEILLCDDTQAIVDKILQTDLIHIKGKRVKRNELEEGIRALNKQHKKPKLILEALKTMVKENKKTINPKDLKAYLWTIAKAQEDQPQEIKLDLIPSKPKEVEIPEVKEEKVEKPIYTEDQIEKAIKRCSKAENIGVEFLKLLRKKSETVFLNTISKYIVDDELEAEKNKILNKFSNLFTEENLNEMKALFDEAKTKKEVEFIFMGFIGMEPAEK